MSEEEYLAKNKKAICIVVLLLFSSLRTHRSPLALADETPEDLLQQTTSQADLTLVDPELDQTPLPQLVLPPAEPPATVRLPEMVIKADEWRGVQCGVQEE